MARLRKTVEGTYCKDCRPERFPLPPKETAGDGWLYRSIDNGDVGTDIRVLFEGEDVTQICVAALSGNEGYVVLYQQDIEYCFYCECGGGAAQEVRKGDTTVIEGEIREG